MWSPSLRTNFSVYFVSFKSSGAITNETYYNLSPSGSRPGVLYGLPKIHKANCPIRPIISAVGTFNHKVAQYLVGILKPLASNACTISDTFSFIQELRSIHADSNMVMCSFDVVSLFTNVPLDETIALCTNAMDDKEKITTSISKPYMLQLLNLCTKESAFLFQKKLHKQIDGVAMGSPLGPLLANIFMCSSEEKWLENCPSWFKPAYYRRYVDDCFVLFRSATHVQPFLRYLNSQHTNIKFTCEQEKEGVLPFLDVNVKRDAVFNTSLYRKPTFTGLYTHFSSFVPQLYKSNLITCLFTRAVKICSSYMLLDKEFRYIADLLYKNGYPQFMINNCLRKVLNKVFDPAPIKQKVPRKQLLLILPFTGNHGLLVRNRLIRLYRHFFPMASLRIVFVPSFKLRNWFRFKDEIPHLLQSRVVYEFSCAGCNARYVGQTARHLHTRIAEHCGLSPRTGGPVMLPQFSAIREHCNHTGHPLERSLFSIIARARNKLDLSILESLAIKNRVPKLNTLTSADLHLFTD